MSELKRIRDFKSAKDDVSADELRRQLGQFEGNVSDMGDALKLGAMARLAAKLPDTTGMRGPVISPGQFHFADTRAGTVSLALAKPASNDAGTLIVLIDLGGSAGSFSVSGLDCKFENLTTATVFNVATWAAMIFCDGVDYWRIF
jgi:hypothetical protein